MREKVSEIVERLIAEEVERSRGRCGKGAGVAVGEGCDRPGVTGVLSRA